MYIFEWKKEYSVGNVTIDKQHKYLFLLVNTLYEAMTQGKSSEIIGKTLEELVEYTVIHFKDEEALFIDTDYPNTEEHLKIHKDFTEQVNNFYSEYKKGNVNVRLEVIKMLSNWLSEHIEKMDKATAPFIQSTSKSYQNS